MDCWASDVEHAAFLSLAEQRAQNMSLAKFDGTGYFRRGCLPTALPHDRACDLDWPVVSQFPTISSHLVSNEVLVHFAG